MTGIREGITFSVKVMEHQKRQRRHEPPDEELRAIAAELEATRPRNRLDCVGAPRPCPFMTCRYHLFLEVTPAGSIRIPFPDLELDEMENTCALDVADKGGVILDEIGSLMAVSRERVRQVETDALRNYSEALARLG